MALVMPHKCHAANMHHELQVTPISDDDYFTRNPEFSTWLLERRKVRAHGALPARPCNHALSLL